MAEKITPDMYSSRILQMLGNAATASQNASLGDSVTSEAIVSNIIDKAFRAGVEVGRAAPSAKVGFLASLYICDGT